MNYPWKKEICYPYLCTWQQFDFLVDDNFLEVACRFAKEQGFYPTESKPILLKTHGKCEAIARHFKIGRDFNCLTQRINLFLDPLQAFVQTNYTKYH